MPLPAPPADGSWSGVLLRTRRRRVRARHTTPRSWFTDRTERRPIYSGRRTDMEPWKLIHRIKVVGFDPRSFQLIRNKLQPFERTGDINENQREKWNKDRKKNTEERSNSYGSIHTYRKS